VEVEPGLIARILYVSFIFPPVLAPRETAGFYRPVPVTASNGGAC
jgi:hypothetical protein